MTNITELKKKLLNSFSRRKSKNIAEQMTEIFNDSFHVESFVEGTSCQHSQNAKTITALLEIIEDMQKGLGFYAIDDVIGTAARQTLTATEQKLKNLTEEK